MLDYEKYNYLRKSDLSVNRSKIRKQLSCRIIRFVDDFIIVTNAENQAELMSKIVSEFLAERGLVVNDSKSKIIA